MPAVASIGLPVVRFVDLNGRPAIGGRVRTFVAGTDTLAPTYTDATGATPNTNPIILNARGECTIWFDTTLVYDLAPELQNGTDLPRQSGVSTSGSSSSLQSGLASATGASLVNTKLSFAGAVLRSLQDKSAEQISVKDFGAKGDGFTDDTVAIQAALTAVRLAGGGSVYAPPGTYIVVRSLFVGSNTTFYGAGDATVIRASQTAFVGVNTGVPSTTNCQLVQNYNCGATAITDANIHVSSMLFDYGAVTVIGGGAHAVSMRWVDRPTVSYVRALRGENVTAIRSCTDSMVFRCTGLNQINCFFDHWESPGNATVAFCTGRNTLGNINQGIQMNDTGSGLNTTGSEMLAIGCQLYGVRNSTSNTAAALAFGALDVAGLVRRVRSIGNYVENSDIGLVFSGNTQYGLSQGDTFKGVDQLPIFFQINGSATPRGCRVLDAHLIDCNHIPANIALVSIAGDQNTVRGFKVSNSTNVAPYRSIAWFTNQATNCVVEIDEAQTGTISSRTVNNGTNCTVIDTLNTYSGLGFAPTLTASTGTFTSAAASGTYTKLGVLVFVTYFVGITTNGTAAGSIKLSLPFPADTTNIGLAGRANTSGQAVIATALDANTIFFVRSDGTYPGSNGEQIVISGTYRAAS